MPANLSRGLPSQSSKYRESSDSQWSSPSAVVGGAQLDGLSRRSRYNVIVPISPPTVRSRNRGPVTVTVHSSIASYSSLNRAGWTFRCSRHSCPGSAGSSRMGSRLEATSNKNIRPFPTGVRFATAQFGNVGRAVRVVMVVKRSLAHAALSHRVCTGLPRRRPWALVTEPTGPWVVRGESRLDEHRGHERLRAEGGGPIHQPVFANRVIAALVILRCRLPNTALAVFYGVDRSATTRAVHEVRPLLAARGFADPGEAALRLRTPADVFAYTAAKGVELRLDGTEVRVRRPKAGRPGRRAFTSAHDSLTRSPLPRRSLSQRICVEHSNAEHRQWRPSSGTSSAVNTTRRPIWPSPAWSPTAPPSGDQLLAAPPVHRK